MREGFIYRILTFICLLLPVISFSQQVQVSLSRNQILIGEQISYGLKVKVPQGMKASFFIPDSVPHFDIIEKKDVRAVSNENAVEQVITFTSFDSGQWAFPSIQVLLSGGATQLKLQSDSVVINVGYMPDNGSNELRDIKPVREVHVNDYTWYYILAGLIIFFLLIFMLVNYLSKRKKKPVVNYKQSAVTEAMQSLDELDKQPLNSTAAIRNFHTQLSLIFKRYYSRTTTSDLYNKITSDILIIVQQKNANETSAIASVLRENDAVSFAKYIPSENTSKENLRSLRQIIQSIENKAEKS